MEDINFYAQFLTEGLYIVDSKASVEEKSEVKEPEMVYESMMEKNDFEEKQIPFSGTDSEKLAVVVNYENAEWITLKDKLVLEKILAAINLDLKKIAIINLANSSLTGYKEVVESLKAKNFIFFGTDNAFNEGSNRDEVVEKDSRTLLFTKENITQIAMSKELKKVLWKNMKKMFLE